MSKMILMDSSEVEAMMDRVVTRALSSKKEPHSALPEQITMKEVMAILGVGRRKVLNLVTTGKIKLVSGKGEKYRFSKKQILAL